MILIDLVAKHKSGELRCPATALITPNTNGISSASWAVWWPNDIVQSSAVQCSVLKQDTKLQIVLCITQKALAPSRHDWKNC